MSDKNYIACPEWSKTYSVYKQYPLQFQVKDKVPISKIKFDVKYLDFPNPVLEDEVQRIVNEFYLGAWEPIFVNKKYFLLDGQHRLEAAKRMGLKYIDIVILDTELMAKGS